MSKQNEKTKQQWVFRFSFERLDWFWSNSRWVQTEPCCCCLLTQWKTFILSTRCLFLGKSVNRAVSCGARTQTLQQDQDDSVLLEIKTWFWVQVLVQVLQAENVRRNFLVKLQPRLGSVRLEVENKTQTGSPHRRLETEPSESLKTRVYRSTGPGSKEGLLDPILHLGSGFQVLLLLSEGNIQDGRHIKAQTDKTV